MKNIITIIAIVLLFNVQNTSAQSLTQNQDRPEVIAKTQVDKLTNQLNLTGEQSRTLYRAYVVKEVDYKKLVHGKDLKNADVAADKEKTDATLNETMKKTLTKEQYKTWLSLKEQ